MNVVMESMRPDSADPFHFFTRLMYADNKVGVPLGVPRNGLKFVCGGVGVS